MYGRNSNRVDSEYRNDKAGASCGDSLHRMGHGDSQ